MEHARATPLLDERFLLFETLGRGGMGSVYRAFDRAERRLVAVKVAEEGTGETGSAHPLTAEFEAWSRLRHPNIIRAYEMGRARHGPLPSGTPYLILESFSGRPAHHSLSPGRTDPDHLEGLARDVLSALDHVHDVGLVHRDLKPANILVGESRRGPMRVKLTDFGLATEAGRAGRPGQVSGSLPYVSPESILGLPLDGRSDLYGLGVVLFFLAAGRKPVESRDPRELLRWHLAGPRPDASTDLPGLPDRLARFVVRLLARNREERPASAREALELLGVPRAARIRPLQSGVDRSDLAALRLALDAARGGERRVLRLPADRKASAALVREAMTLAQIHSVAFCRIRGEGKLAEASLGRAVLRLLGTEGSVRADIDAYPLQKFLPIGLVGDLPVWDRTRAGARAWDNEVDLGRASRTIAAFLLEASSRRSLVLVVERGALGDPLVGGVTRAIEEGLARSPRPDDRTGGLVLLLGGRRISLAGADVPGGPEEIPVGFSHRR